MLTAVLTDGNRGQRPAFGAPGWALVPPGRPGQALTAAGVERRVDRGPRDLPLRGRHGPLPGASQALLRPPPPKARRPGKAPANTAALASPGCGQTHLGAPASPCCKPWSPRWSHRRKWTFSAPLCAQTMLHRPGVRLHSRPCGLRQGHQGSRRGRGSGQGQLCPGRPAEGRGEGAGGGVRPWGVLPCPPAPVG